jgi:hypothetical protein
LASFKSNTSRQEVVAEYLAARDEVAALNSEDSGSAYLTQGGAAHARQPDIGGPSPSTRNKPLRPGQPLRDRAFGLARPARLRRFISAAPTACSISSACPRACG